MTDAAAKMNMTRFGSPFENGHDEAEPQPKTAAPDTTQHDTVMEDAVPTADSNAQDAQKATSHPMTASSSSASSAPSTKEATYGSAAAPYGTRSRNRGNPRPNYAEDKEPGVEFELAKEVGPNQRKIAKAPKASDSSNSPPDAAKSTNGPRKVERDAELNGTVQHSHNQPIPGTSTFSARPVGNAAASLPSKKRKAHQPQAQDPPQPAPAAPAVTRKASMATHTANVIQDSNMMSFDHCRSRLRDGKLISDDGTVLEANGKLTTPTFILLQTQGMLILTYLQTTYTSYVNLQENHTT